MSSDPSTLPPPALQARSRRTQDRIYAASTKLLEEGGVDALTVAAAAAEAGVAVGSVYRRFGDKERLLLALQARFTSEFGAEFQQRVTETGLTAQAPPADIISAAVVGVSRTFMAHSTLMRVFMLLGTRNSAVLAEGASASIAGGHYFRDTVMLAAPALRHHADVEAAIDFAYRLTYAACAHRVVHGEHLESDRPADWTQLIEQLRTAVVAYLLSPVELTRVSSPSLQAGP